MSILSQPHFHNEEAAYAYVESKIWANGAVCPHCACVGDRIGKMGGKSTRIGTYKCYNCRKPFTVKVGTIFESSHIPMRLWLQAIFLISSSKKGISSNQLHRTLGVTLKSAWFMTHRIREAMKDTSTDLFGNNGGTVEADETFIGRDFKKKFRAGTDHKQKVLSLIDRATGRARSVVIDNVKVSTIMPILNQNISREATVMTDEASQYRGLWQRFAFHAYTNHSKGEYVSRFNPAFILIPLKDFSLSSNVA